MPAMISRPVVKHNQRVDWMDTLGAPTARTDRQRSSNQASDWASQSGLTRI